MRQSAWVRFPICFALSAILVLICRELVRVNSTTGALAMLVLVLGIATRWGLREGVFTSILCVFAFNFFFLPPVGTLTIADPQNWVALTAFLASAVVASQLSAKAKNRTEEALARRSEIERLYELSRAMLMDDEADLTRAALYPIRDIFALTQVAFRDGDTGSLQPPDPTPLMPAEIDHAAHCTEVEVRAGLSYIPVRFGSRTIGTLILRGRSLTRPEQESIANLVAIGYERIRALKRAAEAEAARQGERLKTSVLDGIAHDLKTPLTAIKTCVTTLITIPPSSEEKRQELLTIIDEETEHLHSTISEAIQLARIESHKIALQRTSFCLRDALDSLLTNFPQPSRVHLVIPPGLMLRADIELLLNAVRQVLENATKYSPPETRIEVTAQETADHTQIAIADSGSGISPSELDRIFDKFYRGKRGRAAGEGSGMGLAIAKGIIEAHGGKILAENRPQRGAVFTIRLPRA